MSILLASCLLCVGLKPRSPGLVDLAIEASKFVPSNVPFDLDTFPFPESPERIQVRATLLGRSGKGETRTRFTAYTKGEEIALSAHWGKLKPAPVDGSLQRAFALAAHRLEGRGISILPRIVRKNRDGRSYFFSFEDVVPKPGGGILVRVGKDRSVRIIGGE